MLNYIIEYIEDGQENKLVLDNYRAAKSILDDAPNPKRLLFNIAYGSYFTIEERDSDGRHVI